MRHSTRLGVRGPLVLALFAACHAAPDELADGSAESSTDGEASEAMTTSDVPDMPGMDAGEEPDPLACSEGQLAHAAVAFINAPQNPDIDTTCTVLEIIDDGFWLDCDKPQPHPFRFLYDLDPESPTETLPFALGQVVSLRVVFDSGGWSFAIRDAQGHPLIIDYELGLSGVGDLHGEFELPTIAPLQVGIVDGLCARDCNEHEGFLPAACLCHRGLGLEFSSGAATLVLTHGHMGSLRGEASGRVYVHDAWVSDNCPESDADYYGLLKWTFVAVR